jgi:peptidoglycan/xylan/chitin deacetylase (PgdA/CDA1 family)
MRAPSVVSGDDAIGALVADVWRLARRRGHAISRHLYGFPESRMIWRSALSIASRGKLSILIFHRVLQRPDPLFPGEPSAAEFDALLRHVKSRFNVLRLCDAVRLLKEGALPSRALAVTFDDGYEDNLSVAAPLLQKYALPATVFVASGYLGASCMWNDLVIEAFRRSKQSELDLTRLALGTHSLASLDQRRAGIERVLAGIKHLQIGPRDELAHAILMVAEVPSPTGLMLSRESIRSLPTWGVDVGAHTVNHPILNKISFDDAWREITENKRDLEHELGRPINLFAYPNGRPTLDYSNEHVRMVRDAGFVGAVTTSWGAATRSSDVFQLPRFTPWTRKDLNFDLLMLRNLSRGAEDKAA